MGPCVGMGRLGEVVQEVYLGDRPGAVQTSGARVAHDFVPTWAFRDRMSAKRGPPRIGLGP